MRTDKISFGVYPMIPRGDYIQHYVGTVPFYESYTGSSTFSVGETQVQITFRSFTTYEWDVDPAPRSRMKIDIFLKLQKNRKMSDDKIVKGFLTFGAGAFFGFRRGVYTAAAALALGPTGFASFSALPTIVAYSPVAYGLFSTIVHHFARDRTSGLISWGYAVGALSTVPLIKKPKFLIPLAVVSVAYDIPTR